MIKNLCSLQQKSALLLFIFCSLSFSSLAAHPNLVITQDDVVKMRNAIMQEGRFQDAYLQVKQEVDLHLAMPNVVPVPKDGGGGYTHERHKKNYQLMYNAGVVYQISDNEKYADYVKSLLLDYAALYPTLGLHPQRKVNAQNPGVFFWQSLNEAVWLVNTIQAYDLIYNTLDEEDRSVIENQLLRPVALFLSEGQPSTFNKVHNHGTWATAGVGMAGYVLNEPEWVEKALYGLEKSGKGGFLKQLDTLFSPQGYYNEGPYYQRYALMPFVTFAKAIENNEPQRNIFDYRDKVLLKAINTTIQLSYNGLFFPINDAIKSKGIDTIELVYGVAVAYQQTKDKGLLDIAKQQGRIVLTGDGVDVAKALDENKAAPYIFESMALGDGKDGDEGALVIMRTEEPQGETVLFKPAAQGLGHGHFDKLTWQLYDKGSEIVTDYGAARFLNVEAKFGGRYLPENNSYAKQTVAHNTVVVDEQSHFSFNLEKANANAPTLHFFENNEHGTVARASIETAYDDVVLDRTIALLSLPTLNKRIVVDVFDVSSDKPHTYDLPLHYSGHLIDTNFEYQGYTNTLSALGSVSGYQHLWLRAKGIPKADMARVTWLNSNGRFYSQHSVAKGNETFLFTQLGAGDPNFNLRNESSVIRRVEGKAHHQFVSVLEPHGEYNPSKEYTLGAESIITSVQTVKNDTLLLLVIKAAEQQFLIAINTTDGSESTESVSFDFDKNRYTLSSRFAVYAL